MHVVASPQPATGGLPTQISGCSGSRTGSQRAEPIGDEPVGHDGAVGGWVTSGAYGHTVGVSLALAYVPANLAQHTNGFEVEILGARCKAARAARPLYDPEGLRMRAS